MKYSKNLLNCQSSPKTCTTEILENRIDPQKNALKESFTKNQFKVCAKQLEEVGYESGMAFCIFYNTCFLLILTKCLTFQ